MHAQKHLNSGLKYLELLLKQPAEYELILGDIVCNENSRCKVRGIVFVGVLFSTWGWAEEHMDVYFTLLMGGEFAVAGSDP
jgi:hypothetical protein